MRKRHAHALVSILVAVAAMTAAGAVGQSQERADLDAIYRIKDEGLQRSQVMEILSHLTDVYGPRLTNSPGIRAAAEYARGRLTDWGLSDVRLESWGPFGPGWSNERFVAHLVSPRTAPLIGYPRAWTPGTNGVVRAEVLRVTLDSPRDFDRYRGKLGGKFVLLGEPRELGPQFDPAARRFSQVDLDRLSEQPDPTRRGPRDGGDGISAEFHKERLQFFVAEGVAALLEPGRGDGGTVFVTDGRVRRDREMPVPLQVVLAAEHYGQLARMLDRNVPVELELDVRNRFHTDTLDSFNIVGEIPGSDKADELVMVGAHFDSWHAGTGTTDNAAGSAVMMEAVRILRATGLPLRRTVRLALWTGEEQGLLGARAYVAAHFADRASMALEPAHGRMSAYFNVDNGTGSIRGVYLQGNEAVAPIFTAWMEPFANLGMTTLAIRSTGGTDHLAFDEVGLPGFQFIQDPVEYSTRTHHSNMDVYERAQPRDLMQNAVIVASFAYHAANREELLPRKPLPKPRGTSSP